MPSDFKNPLGELEAEVMEIMWKCKNATVRSVLNCLCKKRDIAYTTIMTIMFRLHTKGILSRREDESGAYVYSLVEDREHFFARVSERMITNLIKNYGDVAVAQFFNILDKGDFARTREWKRKLKKVR